MSSITLNNLNELIDSLILKSSNVVHTTGDETINGIKTFTSDIQGTIVRAKWADLGEKYITDCQYLPGTLLQFGGEYPAEMTIATTAVNAVVSTAPGFVLNDGSQGTIVCLTGRVPVRINGKVHRFDHIVLDHDGVAKVDNQSVDYFGVALQDKEQDGENLVLCSCKLKL